MKNFSALEENLKDITVDPGYKFSTDQLSSQPCFVKDSHGQFIYANKQFIGHCRMNSLEDLIGKSDYSFFPPVLAQKYVDDDQCLFSKAKPLLNILELTPNGNDAPTWHITHKVPLYNKDQQVCGLIGTFEDPTVSASNHPKINSLIPAINYIKQNFNSRVTISELANICKMSERTFYRHFYNTFNITPQKYLQQHRVLEAIELFRENKSSIANVALKCGFYDHSHFTGEFKKYMSITPKQYLKKLHSN